MFYGLNIDGSRQDVLIKASNGVIASSIVSDFLAYHDTKFENYQIFQVTPEEVEEELDNCVIWGRVGD